MPVEADKKFKKEFEYYFSKKKQDARLLLKDDPVFVKMLCTDYFEIISRHIKHYDYIPFFKWLAQSEAYFVDESKLEAKCYQWIQRKPSEKYQDCLSQSFTFFLNDLWGAIQLCGPVIISKVRPVICWFDSASSSRVKWNQYSEKEQQMHLWKWLGKVLSVDEISMIEIKIHEFEDMNEQIKQDRLNGVDLAAKIANMYRRIPRKFPEGKKYKVEGRTA